MSGTPTRSMSSHSGGTGPHRRHHSHTPSRPSDTRAAQCETTTTMASSNGGAPTSAVLWGVYLHPSVLRLRATAQDIFFAMLQLGYLERCPAVPELPIVTATGTTRPTAAPRHIVTASVDPTHDKMCPACRGEPGRLAQIDTDGCANGDTAAGQASTISTSTNTVVEAWLQSCLRGNLTRTPQLVSFSYVLAATQPSTAEQRARLGSNAMVAEMELERPNTFETILMQPTAPTASPATVDTAPPTTHQLATFNLTRNAERMDALEHVLNTPRSAATTMTPPPRRSGAVGDGGERRGGHRRTLLHDVLAARRRTQERQVSTARAVAMGLQRYLSQARCCARYPLHLYTPTAAIAEAVLCEQLIGHGEGAGLHESALMPGLQWALATMMVGEEASFVIRAPQTYASSLLWSNGGGAGGRPAPRGVGAMGYVNCPEADYLLPYCMKSALHIQIKLRQRTPLYCTLTLPTAHFALATGGAASQYTIAVFAPPQRVVSAQTSLTRVGAEDVPGSSPVSSHVLGVTAKEVSSSSTATLTSTVSPTLDDAARVFAFFRHCCRGVQGVARCGLEVFSAPTQRYLVCLPRRLYALGGVSLPCWLAHALASLPPPPPSSVPSATQMSDAATRYSCYLVTRGELEDEACTLRNLLSCLVAVALHYATTAATITTASVNTPTHRDSSPHGRSSGGDGTRCGAVPAETRSLDVAATLKSRPAKVDPAPLAATNTVTDNDERSLSTLGNESCVAALQVPRYGEVRYRVTLAAADAAGTDVAHYASDPVRALRYVRAGLKEVCALMTFYAAQARVAASEEGVSETGLQTPRDTHGLPPMPFELDGESVDVHFPPFARRARGGRKHLVRLLLNEAVAMDERDVRAHKGATQTPTVSAPVTHTAPLTLDDVVHAMCFVPSCGPSGGSPFHHSPSLLRQRCLLRVLCKVVEKLYWCLYLLLYTPPLEEVCGGGSGTLAAATAGELDGQSTVVSHPTANPSRSGVEDRLAHSLPITRAPRPPCTADRTTRPPHSASHSSSSPSSSASSSSSSSRLTTSSCSSFEPATSPRPPPASETAHTAPNASSRTAPSPRHDPHLLRRRRNDYVAECFHYAALVAREADGCVVTPVPNTAQELCSAALVYAPHRPSLHLLRVALLTAGDTAPSSTALVSRETALHDLQSAITDIQERANRLLATARPAAPSTMVRSRRDVLVEGYRRRLEKLHKVLRRLQRPPPQHDVGPGTPVGQ